MVKMQAIIVNKSSSPVTDQRVFERRKVIEREERVLALRKRLSECRSLQSAKRFDLQAFKSEIKDVKQLLVIGTAVTIILTKNGEHFLLYSNLSKTAFRLTIKGFTGIDLKPICELKEKERFVFIVRTDLEALKCISKSTSGVLW